MSSGQVLDACVSVEKIGLCEFAVSKWGLKRRLSGREPFVMALFSVWSGCVRTS